MALFLCNVTTLETLNVSLLIYDPTCTIRPWRKVGWYVFAPGQTVLPDVLAVDLRTVNGWIGLYAYTASGSMDWQGTDSNTWIAVSNLAHFNQCIDDYKDCPKIVNFKPIFFEGYSDILVYMGPFGGLDSRGSAAEQFHYTQPAVNEMWIMDGSVLVTGMGFVPGTTVYIYWEWAMFDGSVVGSSIFPSSTRVDQEGYISIQIPAIVEHRGGGKLTAQIVDPAYGLTVKKTWIE